MSSGAKSRNKGKRGELEARDLWRRWFPDCKRIYGQSRKGSDAPDIGSPTMNRHYYVEVKRYERLTDGVVRRLFEKMMNDWLAHTKPITEGVCPTPFLMFRQDREPWYVAYVPEYAETTIEQAGYDKAEYWIGEVAVVEWSAFSAALDKIHGGKDE